MTENRERPVHVDLMWCVLASGAAIGSFLRGLTVVGIVSSLVAAVLWFFFIVRLIKEARPS